MKPNQSQRKRKPKYAANKKSFDMVMQAYRDAFSTGIGAMNFANEGKATPNLARPTLVDFRCDVDKVLNKLVTTQRMPWFVAAYVKFSSTDPIEQEVHAQKMIGDGRHELEQSLGAAFLKVHIYPMSGNKGYFQCVRQGVK